MIRPHVSEPTCLASPFPWSAPACVAIQLETLPLVSGPNVPSRVRRPRRPLAPINKGIISRCFVFTISRPQQCRSFGGKQRGEYPTSKQITLPIPSQLFGSVTFGAQGEKGSLLFTAFISYIYISELIEKKPQGRGGSVID
jgi:hypothetical protein